MGFNSLLIVWLFLASGGMGLPAGFPPAAEDPLMARIAPEKVKLFVTWTGVEQPDANADPTQKWMAQPEIQTFSKKLIAAAQRQLAEEQSRGSGQQVLKARKLLARVAALSTTNATTLYVREFEIEGRREDFRAAGIVALNDSAAAVQAMIDELVPRDPQLATRYFNRVEENGVARVRYIDPGSQHVTELAIWDGYFVMGVGAGELDALIANSKTGPPEWYTKARKELAVKKFASLSYLSVDWRKMSTTLSFWGMRTWDEKLASIGDMCYVAGLDDLGMVTRASLDVDPERGDLLAILNAQPLDEKYFQRLPKRPTFSMAGRVSIDDVVRELGNLDDELGEDTIKEADERFRETFGVGLKDGLLDSLDGFVGMHYSLDMDMPFKHVVFTIGIADEMSFPALHEAVLKSIRKWHLEKRHQLQQEVYQLQDIYWLRLPNVNWFGPSRIAWSVVQEELVIASDVDSIKKQIDRTIDRETFADSPEHAQLIRFGLEQKLGNPIAVASIDLASVLSGAFKWLKMFNMADDYEILPGLTFGEVPAAEIWTNDVRPNITGVYRTESGLQLYSRQTIPGSSPLVTLAATGGFGVIARLDKFVQSDIAISKRNLMQLGLACWNFESAYQKFPATGTKSADGKPLLSWRVHLLPFLDQQKLYEEFHLDEPWDSPHNKPLLKRMPTTFRHPSLKLPAGKTVYLGVTGPDGMLGELSQTAKGSHGVAKVVDGTSNTALVVEVDGEAAVEWTRPADLTTDGTKALAATKRAKGGTVNVAMGDGSVRRFAKLTAEFWEQLLTMNDGQVIDLDSHRVDP